MGVDHPLVAGNQRRNGGAFGRGHDQVIGAAPLAPASWKCGGKQRYAGRTAAFCEILESDQSFLGAEVVGGAAKP